LLWDLKFFKKKKKKKQIWLLIQGLGKMCGKSGIVQAEPGVGGGAVLLNQDDTGATGPAGAAIGSIADTTGVAEADAVVGATAGVDVVVA